MHYTKFSGHCKYVVADVDDTFLATDKSLIDENVEAVKELRKAGIKFAFATGRYWRAMQPMIDMLELKAPQIYDNGATIFNPVDGSMTTCAKLGETTARFLYTGFRKAGYSPTLCTPREYYNAKPVSDIAIEQLKRHNELSTIIESDDILLDNYAVDAIKIGIFSNGDDSHLQRTVTRLTRQAFKLGMPHNPVYTEKGIVVITPEKVDKVNGILKATEQLGITMHDVITIGDGDNDACMLALSGFGFAVANGTARAMSSAISIVSSNDAGGFAQAVDFILKFLK